MDAATICNRNAITASVTDELVDAAKLMRDKHVGFLVVTEARPDGGHEPVGVLTDRDIVVAVIAREVDPESLSVGDVMTRQPALAQASDSLEEALRKMREIGVRRLPVVDAARRLIGVLALDDVLDHVAGQLTSIAISIRKEQRIERQLRT